MGCFGTTEYPLLLVLLRGIRGYIYAYLVGNYYPVGVLLASFCYLLFGYSWLGLVRRWVIITQWNYSVRTNAVIILCNQLVSSLDLQFVIFCPLYITIHIGSKYHSSLVHGISQAVGVLTIGYFHNTLPDVTGW